MQNVDKIKAQSGWRGEAEMLSDELSQTSALTFTQLRWEVKRALSDSVNNKMNRVKSLSADM